MQDLVLNITSGKSAAPDFERQFLAELVDEVLAFRAAFQHLLSSMSSFNHHARPLTPCTPLHPPPIPSPVGTGGMPPSIPVRRCQEET